MEVWRSIDGFSGYEISSYGRVIGHKNNRGIITDSEYLLKPRVNPNGYLIVVLYDENRVPHQLSVHRLVAQSFIPNHDGYPYVDHLDGNKTNNMVDNLEWVTPKENSIRAVNAGLYEPIFKITRKPVMVTNLRNGEEKYFRGVNEAARAIGYSPAIVSKVVNMLRNTIGYYAIEFAGREERLLYDEN